jgi:SAM-dependent methyltransferase
MTWRRSLRALACRSRTIRRLALSVRFGDLGRVAPLTRWGYARGLPVDRWYIEAYLRDHAHLVSGHVLEIKEDCYASRLGASSVDVVDIDPTNEEATIVGDLCDPDTLVGVSADAVVLTQTLQYLTDPSSALQHLLGCLRPGGAMLVTVPCVQRVDGAGDLWRWTPSGLERQLRAALGSTPAELEVVGLGNGLAARAALFGMAADDLDPVALHPSDSALPLIAAASVRLTC